MILCAYFIKYRVSPFASVGLLHNHFVDRPLQARKFVHFASLQLSFYLLDREPHRIIALQLQAHHQQLVHYGQSVEEEFLLREFSPRPHLHPQQRGVAFVIVVDRNVLDPHGNSDGVILNLFFIKLQDSTADDQNRPLPHLDFLCQNGYQFEVEKLCLSFP